MSDLLECSSHRRCFSSTIDFEPKYAVAVEDSLVESDRPDDDMSTTHIII